MRVTQGKKQEHLVMELGFINKVKVKVSMVN